MNDAFPDDLRTRLEAWEQDAAAAVYAALRPAQVANLVNLAGPINYHDQGIYSVWTRPAWFDADRLVDTLGNIPAPLLNMTFHAMRPTNELVQALNYWENTTRMTPSCGVSPRCRSGSTIPRGSPAKPSAITSPTSTNTIC
jgi:hypothetical protein